MSKFYEGQTVEYTGADYMAEGVDHDGSYISYTMSAGDIVAIAEGTTPMDGSSIIRVKFENDGILYSGLAYENELQAMDDSAIKFNDGQEVVYIGDTFFCNESPELIQRFSDVTVEFTGSYSKISNQPIYRISKQGRNGAVTGLAKEDELELPEQKKGSESMMEVNEIRLTENQIKNLLKDSENDFIKCIPMDDFNDEVKGIEATELINIIDVNMFDATEEYAVFDYSTATWYSVDDLTDINRIEDILRDLLHDFIERYL